MKLIIPPLLVAMILSVLSSAGAAVEQNTRRYADYYGPLTEHNIFMKDRPVKPKPTSVPASAPVIPPRQVEESLVLRGITFEADGFHADVEDLSDGKILKLVPGDTIGRGLIQEIDIDDIQYEHNGELRLISPGQDFTGTTVITLTATTGPSTGPVEVIDANNPNMTAEQRMKFLHAHPELQK